MRYDGSSSSSTPIAGRTLGWEKQMFMGQRPEPREVGFAECCWRVGMSTRTGKRLLANGIYSPFLNSHAQLR